MYDLICEHTIEHVDFIGFHHENTRKHIGFKQQIYEFHNLYINIYQNENGTNTRKFTRNKLEAAIHDSGRLPVHKEVFRQHKFMLQLIQSNPNPDFEERDMLIWIDSMRIHCVLHSQVSLSHSIYAVTISLSAHLQDDDGMGWDTCPLAI